jgi:hypothetical protein
VGRGGGGQGEAGQEREETWRRPTLPGGYPPSIIGAGGLNCRVREGTGCTPAAPDTKKAATPARLTADPHGKVQSAASAEVKTHRVTHTPERQNLCNTVKKKKPSTISTGKLTHYCVYTARLSNASSSRGLTWFSSEGSHLGMCFLLRCFQQLSPPETATERCRWRDNSHTGAPSTPVLSY